MSETAEPTPPTQLPLILGAARLVELMLRGDNEINDAGSAVVHHHCQLERAAALHAGNALLMTNLPTGFGAAASAAAKDGSDVALAYTFCASAAAAVLLLSTGLLLLLMRRLLLLLLRRWRRRLQLLLLLQ